MLTTHPRQGKFLRVRNDFLLIWIDFKDMDRILNIRRSRLLYVPAPPTNAYLRSCFQTQIPFKHTPHVSLYVKTSSRRTWTVYIKMTDVWKSLNINPGSGRHGMEGRQ